MGNSVVKAHGVAALALVAGLAAALFLLWPWDRSGWTVLLALFIAVNVTAFAYYGFDKLLARAGSRRVPERVLLGLAAGGGSIGAWLGMKVFRHKTVKASFQRQFWWTVAWQVAVLVVIVVMMAR